MLSKFVNSKIRASAGGTGYAILQGLGHTGSALVVDVVTGTLPSEGTIEICTFRDGFFLQARTQVYTVGNRVVLNMVGAVTESPIPAEICFVNEPISASTGQELVQIIALGRDHLYIQSDTPIEWKGIIKLIWPEWQDRSTEGTYEVEMQSVLNGMTTYLLRIGSENRFLLGKMHQYASNEFPSVKMRMLI